MSKQEKIRAVVDELRALGWTFVAARDRVQCQHFAMQDQAMTRRNPLPDESSLALDIAMRLVDIGMRRESGS